MVPMKAKTLKALRGSIAKWESIVEGTGIDIGAGNCPLCRLFHFGFGGKKNPVKCGGCPVREATGQHGCLGSPYDVIEDIEDQYGTGSEEYAKAAKAELDFLKGLLPAEAEAVYIHKHGE